MIPKLFLLAISFNLLIASCHDNFSKNSFEESSDELIEFINEYFLEKNITFLPNKSIKNIKVFNLEQNISKVVLYIKEPNRLKAFEAFNTFNDMLGNLFYDYNIDSQSLEFIPYEKRVYYKDIYFGVTIKVYGIIGSSSQDKTTAKIELTNYSSWVKENIKCRSKK